MHHRTQRAELAVIVDSSDLKQNKHYINISSSEEEMCPTALLDPTASGRGGDQGGGGARIPV